MPPPFQVLSLTLYLSPRTLKSISCSTGHQNEKMERQTKNPYSIDEILRSEQGTSAVGGGDTDRKRRHSDADSEEDIGAEEGKVSRRTSPANGSGETSCLTAAKASITEVNEEKD